MKTASTHKQHQSLQQVLTLGQVWSANDAPDKPQAGVGQNQVLSSGFPQLDQYLPAQGWQPGQVCEIYAQPGNAEVSLITPALRQLSLNNQWILWVAPPAIPYAPALFQTGIRLERILVVQSDDYQKSLWSMEQGLRSGQCSAVLGWPQQWHKSHIRRLQIAASDSHSFCWLWLQTPFDPSGSPAALRLRAQRYTHGLTLEFLKRRGCWPSQAFKLPLANGV